MKGNIEFKSSFAGIKDVDTKNRIVTGYLSEFGSMDYDQDIIEKGAFAKSIMERKSDIFFLGFSTNCFSKIIFYILFLSPHKPHKINLGKMTTSIPLKILY